MKIQMLTRAIRRIARRGAVKSLCFFLVAAYFCLLAVAHLYLIPNYGYPYVEAQTYPFEKFYGNTTEEIPKIIWTYWGNGVPPAMVQRCLKTWKQHNPDHSIIVLNRKSIELVFETPIPKDFDQGRIPAAQADWVRLTVLMEKGGIWMDASMILRGSLDYIHQKQKEHRSEGFVFFLDGYTAMKEYPVVEPWYSLS